MMLTLLLILGTSTTPMVVSTSYQEVMLEDQQPEIGRVVALVREGRALIARGMGEEARALLEEADALDGGKLRTRIWLARALIEMNYLNDALDITDDLAAAGNEGPEIDYLYGMAFTYKARKYIGEGVNSRMIGMHFSESVAYLGSATQADPIRFYDAFLPLAEAAWNSQQLETARAAAQAAVEISSSAPAELFMLAEVAFSQFVVANGDETLQSQADAHWQVAFESFVAVADSADKELIELRARANKKAADALVWKQRIPEAATRYANAIGLSPASVAFDQMLGSLGQDSFLDCLESGSAAFNETHAAEDPADVSLLWWLGWARFMVQDYTRSREAFTSSLAKWPAFTNCNWYIALCDFHTQDPDAAIKAILEYAELDTGALVGSVQSDLTTNLGVLDGLIGHCFEAGRTLDAARLSAVQANSAPDSTRYWNNVGLFYRDAGDELSKDEKNDELRQQYFEKAYEGYGRALDLEPENPALLNDTAVILHYCLKRDLEEAKRMYALANEQAVAELARADLAEDRRELYTVAKRDSSNNLARLEKLMRRLEAAGETPEDPGGP